MLTHLTVATKVARVVYALLSSMFAFAALLASLRTPAYRR